MTYREASAQFWIVPKECCAGKYWDRIGGFSTVRSAHINRNALSGCGEDHPGRCLSVTDDDGMTVSAVGEVVHE